jgi:hypothetical protein
LHLLFSAIHVPSVCTRRGFAAYQSWRLMHQSLTFSISICMGKPPGCMVTSPSSTAKCGPANLHLYKPLVEMRGSTTVPEPGCNRRLVFFFLRQKSFLLQFAIIFSRREPVFTNRSEQPC